MMAVTVARRVLMVGVLAAVAAWLVTTQTFGTYYVVMWAIPFAAVSVYFVLNRVRRTPASDQLWTDTWRLWLIVFIPSAIFQIFR